MAVAEKQNMNTFEHSNIRFQYPPHWLDASRLMLVQPADGTNIQIGKVRPDADKSAEQFFGAYCSKVLDDLKPLGGQLLEMADFQHERCIGKSFTLEFTDDSKQLWRQLHVILPFGEDAYSFVWTVRESAFDAQRSEVNEMVGSFVVTPNSESERRSYEFED